MQSSFLISRVRSSRHPKARRATNTIMDVSSFVMGVGQDANLPDSSSTDLVGGSNLFNTLDTPSDLGNVTSSDVTPSSDTPITGGAITSTQSSTPSWLSSLGTSLSGLFGGVVKSETPALVSAITGQPTTAGRGGLGATGAPGAAGLPPGGSTVAAIQKSIMPFALIGGAVVLFLIMRKR